MTTQAKKVVKIKPLEGYTAMSDADIVQRGTAAQTGLTGNSNFQNLPVDLAVLKTDIESLSALIAESLDGSKKVIAQKNKQREAVIKMLLLLGRFVEVHCNGDMAIFTSSGFVPASTAKVPPAPLPLPVIRSVDHERRNRGPGRGHSQGRPLRNSSWRAGQRRCARLMDEQSGHEGQATRWFSGSDARHGLRVSSSRVRQGRLHRLDGLGNLYVHLVRIIRSPGASAPGFFAPPETAAERTSSSKRSRSFRLDEMSDDRPGRGRLPVADPECDLSVSG